VWGVFCELVLFPKPMWSGFGDGSEVPSVVFIYVGNIKLCLDSMNNGFYIVFGVAFIDRNMCQWNICCRGNISCILLLLCGKVSIY
jgi:hypothetical protein